MEEPKKQRPRLPELELSVAVRLLKNEGVFIQPADKPYWVRFKQLATGLELQGQTHNKGNTISPRFLSQILERFNISIYDFLEAIAASKKGPQSV